MKKKYLLFTPPVFADQEKTYAARVLYALLWTLIIAATLFAVTHIILDPVNTIHMIGIGVVIVAANIFCLTLTRRGNTRLASVVGLLQIWLIISALAISRGGVNATTIAGYLVIVLAAGILLGRAGGLTMAALCSLSELLFAYLGSTGNLPPSSVQHSAFASWTVHSVFAILVVVFQNAATRTIRNALTRANQELDERKRAEVLQHATFRIAQAADISQNLDDLFRAIHEIIKEVITANNFYIALFDEEANMVSFPYFVDEVDPQPSPKPLGRGLTDYVIRTGQVLLAPPNRFEELLQAGEIDLIGTPSIDWLGVPLKKEDKVYGAIVVQSYSEAVRFGEREKDILTFVSQNIENAINRKVADEKLRKSEEEYRNLVESARDVIFTLSPNGDIETLNPAFKTTTGWKRSMWIGKNFSEIIHPDDYREAQRTFADLLKRMINGTHPFRVRRSAGGYVIGEFTLTPQLKDGKLDGIFGIARDITERRKAEEEKKSLEKQLQQAQKMESIGTLAGGIAHDFNNILAIILGHISLVEKNKMNPERFSASVKAVSDATRRGASLVKQILTFARKSDATTESVRVNEIIKELRTLFSETFPKTIILDFRLGDKIPSINADHTQIHQVLLNLCVNARDAMMPKGGTLGITTSTVSGDSLLNRFEGVGAEEYVHISVSDTGMGMDDATRQRIFEPFFTTKEKGKGTGLGLAVVYGVVTSHNGFIDIESQVGKGTTFHLYFPVPPRIVEQKREEVVAHTPEVGGNETILVVEDEEMLQELLSTLLESMGYKIIRAHDGVEAVDIYRHRSRKIDLVLSDMGLPRLGGMDAFKLMKEINPDVKVIFASGFIDANVRSEMLKAGVKDIVQKPYDPKQILRKIREVLDRK